MFNNFFIVDIVKEVQMSQRHSDLIYTLKNYTLLDIYQIL